MRKLYWTLSLFFIFNTAWANSDYLSVAGWQNCTKAIDEKIYKSFCLPPDKPAGCSASSWNQLTKGQLLPLCPLCPKK